MTVLFLEIYFKLHLLFGLVKKIGRYSFIHSFNFIYRQCVKIAQKELTKTDSAIIDIKVRIKIV